MIDLDMTRAGDHAHLRLTGQLCRQEDAASIAAAIAFVPAEEHLVVHLDGVVEVADEGIVAFVAAVEARDGWAETVVVSPDMDVTVQLVLHDLDRVVPVVRTEEHAVEVIRARAGISALGS